MWHAIDSLLYLFCSVCLWHDVDDLFIFFFLNMCVTTI